MGKDTLSPLPVPDPGSGTETLPALSAAAASFDVFPNPVRATADLRLSSSFVNGKQVRISVLDQQGRVVQGFQGRPDQGKGFSATWRPGGLPSGVYVLRAETGTETLVKKAVLLH
jgi:hypothetical protein